jgi:hypothetical protein
MQVFYLMAKDNTSATGKDPDMPAAPFMQQVVHILQELIMPALVRSEGNGLNIFLYCTIHDLLYRPVMAKMDDFSAAGLQYAAHNVYSCIVSVEQRSSRNNPDMIFRFIRFWYFH